MTDTADTGRRALPAERYRQGRRFTPSCGVRSPAAVLLTVLLVGIAVAWLGHEPSPLPTATGTESSTPSWRMLAMFAGVLPLLSLHSPMPELEACATNRFYRGRAVRLTGLWLVSMVLFLSVSAVEIEGRILGVMAVALPGWTGLGLASGRLLGWRQSWALPAVVLCALTYWGAGGVDDTHLWWDFTVQPARVHPSGLAVSLVLLTLGLGAYALTPWRLRMLPKWR